MPERSDPPQNTENANPPLKELAGEKAPALDPADSVKTAGERLRENQTSRWPVAADRKLVGAVEQENPDLELGGHGHDPESWKVAQIMSRELTFCYEDEDCATALRTMQERGLRFLPVVDKEMRIVGIFSREGIEASRRALTEAEATPASVEKTVE